MSFLSAFVSMLSGANRRRVNTYQPTARTTSDGRNNHRKCTHHNRGLRRKGGRRAA